MRRKRLVSAVLIAAFILTLAPATAQAADVTISAGGFYNLAGYGDGSTITIDTTEAVTLIGSAGVTYRNVQIVCNEGTNLTLSNVKINNDGFVACALSFTGQDNTLMLEGENILTSGNQHPGVKVASGTTLVIDATDDTGSLTANGGSLGGAGIGGGAGSIGGGEGGSIAIYGGEVTANGGFDGGAGIGGGAGGVGGGEGGSITISGGTVNAKGGERGGAGIGGGNSAGFGGGGGGGTITINGGKVTANGGLDHGAGIGGGGGLAFGGGGGIITINGGEVTANGGSFDGAGIGGGSSAGSGGGGGSIVINGGTVSANGSSFGAGIGGGGGAAGGGGGSITISGGTVNGKGGSDGGAGIGGGAVGGGGGSITISGGSVNAKGAGAGADIGATPTNGQTPAEDVFLTTVRIEDAGGSPVASTPLVSVTTVTTTGASYAYGMEDMETDADGNLYLYLPEDTHTTAARTATAKYSGEVTTRTDPVASAGTLSVDAVAPVVYSVTPSGAGSPLSGDIAITFDEEMRTVSGAVYLSPNGAGYSPLGPGIWSGGNTTYTTSYSGLDYNTQYTVKIEGFRDFSGNEMVADANHTFTTMLSSDASLSGLSISQGTLSPVFSGGVYEYTVSVANSVSALTVTPTTSDANATVKVNDEAAPSGAASSPILLQVGANTITVKVTAQDGTTTQTYRIAVTRGQPAGTGGRRRSPEPVYGADISDGGTLEVTVNEESGNASVTAGDAVGAELENGGNVTISMPSVPGVTSYTLGIPVAYLSIPGGGTLTFTTDTGSMTLPADMLSGITGAEGKRAEITIGVGDKSGLSEAARAAIGDRPLIEISLTLDGAPTEWNNTNSPVTVCIPYEPTPEERQNPDAIVIWYIDGSGNLVCVPNGHYDPETGTVTFETTHFSQYAVGYNPVTFRDIAESAWYSRAVSFIAARGITSGTGDGNYSPEAKLTRGEFMVLMMRAYEIAPDQDPSDNFLDAGNTYYTGYLAAAKRLGITAGVGNNLYAPDREITRQEMFTLLYNALRVIGRLPEGDTGKTLDQFSDVGEIASWAREAMTLLVKTGVVGGSNGKLSLLSTTTRAEMAQVLYNLLRK